MQVIATRCAYSTCNYLSHIRGCVICGHRVTLHSLSFKIMHSSSNDHFRYNEAICWHWYGLSQGSATYGSLIRIKNFCGAPDLDRPTLIERIYFFSLSNVSCACQKCGLLIPDDKTATWLSWSSNPVLQDKRLLRREVGSFIYHLRQATNACVQQEIIELLRI